MLLSPSKREDTSVPDGLSSLREVSATLTAVTMSIKVVECTETSSKETATPTALVASGIVSGLEQIQSEGETQEIKKKN